MSKNLCPFIKKKCMEHDCTLYISLRGTNKNTGQPVNEWGCSLAWLPVLLIENVTESKMTSAAVDSFKNEMVKQNDNILRLESN